MRIYTRTGDSGQTGLYGGARVSKDDVRVEAYGTCDEACAALGVAAAQIGDASLRGEVEALQRLCFELGADLATPFDAPSAGRVRRIDPARTASLEASIDAHEATLEPLRTFILPGGAPAAAALHLARAVVRRAERRVATLLRAAPDDANPETLRCLNRMGDLCFVLARVANARQGLAETPWTP